MSYKSTHSFSLSKSPRLGPSALPPCQSNEVASGSWARLNNHGSADTPRNRFDYAVEVHQAQQKAEWFSSKIRPSMYGDTESQNKVARKWVVGQWQKWGIWTKEWPENGPGSQEQWGNGLPACLLAMELAWEIEHIATVRQPVDISKICDTEGPHGQGFPPMYWPWDLVAEMAAKRLLNRHCRDGFPDSEVELPSVAFRQDLKSLSVNLPEPVQKLVATVEKWDNLGLPPAMKTKRRNIFGAIGMYTKASTLEADGARDSDDEDGAPNSDSEIEYGKPLFGISQREPSTLEAGGGSNLYETVRNCEEASTLEAGGARDSDNENAGGRYVVLQVESGQARRPGYRTVRKCDKWEDVRRLVGISDEEASPVKESVFLTKSGRALFGIPCTLGARRVRKADGEETVRTSGRQVEGARNSDNEQVLPKDGGARKPDLAEIAASIRAMRGPRRRERHRKPGDRIVRQTQGGRVQKSSKQARP